MVTRAQISKLAGRIDALEVVLNARAPGAGCIVYLSYAGETQAEFRARYPDYPDDARDVVVLSLDDDTGHAMWWR
jgi:hypothetical protein